MTRTLRGLIKPQDIHLDVATSCKRSILECLSRLVAERYGLEPTLVLEKLGEREQLGSTGVGNGIALPHARLPIDELGGLVLRLKERVSFDAIDGEPVDLVFLLVAPEADNTNHLKALSRIARTLRMPGVVEAVRGADDAETAYAALLSENDAAAA